MIDNRDVNEILEKLENLEDEELAVKLLREFNSLTSENGKLLLNLDKSLSHDEWKAKCDKLNKEIESLITKIKNL